MISKEIINKLAEIELVQANHKHPELFASMHEAYAVLKEELEETSEELELCNYGLDQIWCGTKSDDYKLVHDALDPLEQHSWQCVAEAIQVLAMCKKARLSMEVPDEKV